MVWTPNLARVRVALPVPSFWPNAFFLFLILPPGSSKRTQAARTVITAVERPKMQFVILLAATPALRLAPLVTRSSSRLASPVMSEVPPTSEVPPASEFTPPAMSEVPPESQAPPMSQQVAQMSQQAALAQADGVFQGRAVPTQTSSTGMSSSVLVQGGALRTWSFRSHAEEVQIVLSTEGRPLDADIELWHGPNNVPVKMRVYSEDGHLQPFTAVLETPSDFSTNTVAVRNIARLEYPLAANVFSENVDHVTEDCISASAMIQGGALRTYPFDASVDAVQVLLRTDGRPLNARIEVLHGPNSNRQVVELYSEDGFYRPFVCFLETPDYGSVVRVVNTGDVEFPLTASVFPRWQRRKLIGVTREVHERATEGESPALASMVADLKAELGIDAGKQLAAAANQACQMLGVSEDGTVKERVTRCWMELYDGDESYRP